MCKDFHLQGRGLQVRQQIIHHHAHALVGRRRQYIKDGFFAVHDKQVAVIGKMQEFDGMGKVVEKPGDFPQLAGRQPHTVERNEPAGAVLGNDVAAQDHFVFRNVASLGQQFQISPVRGNFFLRYAEQAQDAGQAARHEILSADTDFLQLPLGRQAIHVGMLRPFKRRQSVPGRNGVIPQSVNQYEK